MHKYLNICSNYMYLLPYAQTSGDTIRREMWNDVKGYRDGYFLHHYLAALLPTSFCVPADLLSFTCANAIIDTLHFPVNWCTQNILQYTEYSCRWDVSWYGFNSSDLQCELCKLLREGGRWSSVEYNTRTWMLPLFFIKDVLQNTFTSEQP